MEELRNYLVSVTKEELMKEKASREKDGVETFQDEVQVLAENIFDMIEQIECARCGDEIIFNEYNPCNPNLCGWCNHITEKEMNK